MIAETFDRINKWLEENAPKIANQSLQKGATDRQIEELETIIGKKLPADFKELYNLHNGLSDEENFGSLFYGMNFFSTDKIISEFKAGVENTEIIPLEKCDEEIDGSNIFNPNWLGFCFDGSHTSLCLDFAPTDKGTFGQIIFIDAEYNIGILAAQSTGELLENFASDLENDLYILDEDALEDGNEFLTADQSIDLVNWSLSEEWKRFKV